MLCSSCPRNCKVDRQKSVGFCSCPKEIIVAKYMLHHWEEPIISGDENSAGSGAIFFGGCNLKCVYCQNEEISFNPKGIKMTPNELAGLFKKIEEMGALNINLVSPTQYTNEIIKAIKIYRPKIPIIWNSSGYESVTEIKKLKNYIDIYLVDLKYMDDKLSADLSNAKDYPQIATKAIKQMKQNQNEDIIINGLMKKGVIVRHLVLPNCIKNSFLCLDWIKETLGEEQYISLMSQYFPNQKVKNNPQYSDINRSLHPIEYKRVLNYLYKLKFRNGFIQELTSANCCFIPNFSKFKD